MSEQSEENNFEHIVNVETAESFNEMCERHESSSSKQMEVEEEHSISMSSFSSIDSFLFEGSFELSDDIIPQIEDAVESEDLKEQGEIIEGNRDEQEIYRRKDDAKIEIPDMRLHLISLTDLGEIDIGKRPTVSLELDFNLSGSVDKESTKSTQYEEEYEMILEEEEGGEQLWESEEHVIEEEEIPFFAKKSAKTERLQVKQIDLAPVDTEDVDEDDADVLFRELLEREEREKMQRKLEEERLRKKKEEKDVLEASGAYELIDAVAEASVETSERIDPENILRHKLDKAKIIRQIKIMLADAEEEDRKRLIFTQRIIGHFRKKKYKRALTEDDPATLTDAMKRYRDSLIRLDKANTKQKLYSFQMENKINVLQNLEEEKKSELDSKLNDLKLLLKEVRAVAVISEGSFLQEKEINKIMEKVNILRKQISKFRMKYILGQHTFCTLQQEIKDLEDIGAGIKLIDYEQLKAETFNLAAKLEERSNEIGKLGGQCRGDAHFLAHIREKEVMLDEMLSRKSEILITLMNDLTNSRNYLTKLKVTRDEIRKEQQDLNCKSGLLGKPHLLHDYDATLNEIKEIKLRVNNLKKVKQNLMMQLGKTTKKLINK